MYSLVERILLMCYAETSFLFFMMQYDHEHDTATFYSYKIFLSNTLQEKKEAEKCTKIQLAGIY